LIAEETREEIGFAKHTPTRPIKDEWGYKSLYDVHKPKPHPENENWATSIYRGIVPAKNLFHRDFAIAGALVRHTYF